MESDDLSPKLFRFPESRILRFILVILSVVIALALSAILPRIMDISECLRESLFYFPIGVLLLIPDSIWDKMDAALLIFTLLYYLGPYLGWLLYAVLTSFVVLSKTRQISIGWYKVLILLLLLPLGGFAVGPEFSLLCY